MKLYKKTGCRALLIGRLNEMPVLHMDVRGEFSTQLVVATQKPSASNSVLFYHVFVQGTSALRIRQFGFVGLHLWIEGSFQNTGEIFAEKISFLAFPESGEVDQEYKLNRNFVYHEKFQLSYIDTDQNNSDQLTTVLH